jgi:hypothetical protein
VPQVRQTNIKLAQLLSLKFGIFSFNLQAIQFMGCIFATFCDSCFVGEGRRAKDMALKTFGAASKTNKNNVVSRAVKSSRVHVISDA